jgi:hypothetical protein
MAVLDEAHRQHPRDRDVLMARARNWDLSWPERCVMPHSTASCAALESAQCDFSHSL